MQIKLASGLGGLIVPHRANTSCTIIIPTIKVNSQIILFVFFAILNSRECSYCSYSPNNACI